MILLLSQLLALLLQSVLAAVAAVRFGSFREGRLYVAFLIVLLSGGMATHIRTMTTSTWAMEFISLQVIPFHLCVMFGCMFLFFTTLYRPGWWERWRLFPLWVMIPYVVMGGLCVLDAVTSSHFLYAGITLRDGHFLRAVPGAHRWLFPVIATSCMLPTWLLLLHTFVVQKNRRRELLIVLLTLVAIGAFSSFIVMFVPSLPRPMLGVLNQTGAVLAFGYILFGSRSLEYNQLLLQEAREELKREQENFLREMEISAASSQLKARFLAVMSHELRTPLNAMIGYTEMVKEELEEEGRDELVADLDSSHEAAMRLFGMIDDLLEMTELEAGESVLAVSVVSVQALLTEVVEETKQQFAASTNDLTLLPCEPDVSFYCEHTKLRHMLLSLLDNSMKFTKGGTISLQAQLATREDTQFVCFEVKDSGVGIPPEKRETVFEAFSLGDDSYTRTEGGVGIGLALVKKMMEIMGGMIEIESCTKAEVEAGQCQEQGTTVRLYLPARGPMDSMRLR